MIKWLVALIVLIRRYIEQKKLAGIEWKKARG